MSWKAIAGALQLPLILTLLGRGADGQGNGLGKREVSGSSTIYLGQDIGNWRPVIHTTVNLSEISSIKSSFQFRTFDPEGVIFYGDTKDGEDWFVLSLKEGIPLIQISKGDVHVSVADTQKLNDGQWHTLEVSSQGKFVILKVDDTGGLVVGMQSKQTEEVISGKLRLALGGILINKEKMIVQFEPQMDGCVRNGNWLNLSIPWVAETDKLRPCYENIKPGSYFSGTGFAIFNTSVFQIEEDDEFQIELRGDFDQMNGTIFSIKSPGITYRLFADNNKKRITLVYGSQGEIYLDHTNKKMLITFRKNSVSVAQYPGRTTYSDGSVSMAEIPNYLASWREGRLAIGGLLGEDGDDVGSEFFTGCLEKIEVQGRDLDLDLAHVKHVSISAHSCPA